MSRLIESIKLLDGEFFNVSYHGQRMKSSLEALFADTRPLNLENILRETEHPETGIYKCRIVYDDHSREISFDPYQARSIKSVRVVEDNNISYPFKYADRGEINRLFALRGNCDDVMIVCKGKVTDCSYSNVVFRKGRNWFTPDTPLLKGTMRQKLLDDKKIQATEIRLEDIRSFESFKLINAMLEFGSPEIEVSKIVF